MNIKCLIVGDLGTNCYILTENNKCVLIDCGGNDELARYVESKNLILEGIYLTHGHFDHTSGLFAIREKYDVPIYAYKDEKIVLENPDNNLSSSYDDESWVIDKVRYLGEVNIDILGHNFKVIHTPGHTVGGCCYYCEELKVLFSGDTLFCETYGRYDLPTSDLKSLILSIDEKLMCLPDDTEVKTGHGFPTSIKHERKSNEITWSYVYEYGKKL